jgi:hypothetical protein
MDKYENEIQTAVDDAASFFMGRYLTWFNDYLTLDKFAEDHGITRDKAEVQIRIGKKIHNQLTNSK